MSSQAVQGSSEPSASVRREAAVWIARIHSPERTLQVEAGLRQWLRESPEHQRVFEQANELWETSAQLPDGALPRMMRWQRVAGNGFPRARAAIACGIFAVLAVVVGAYYGTNSLREPALTTGVGEQRVVALEDGTRVSLNTATRLVVQYDETARRIRLESGEALFEVSKQPRWPFVVTVGDRTITALGTAFIVRRDERRTAVTLVEGKVSVAPRAVSPLAGEVERAGAITMTLGPGERLTFAGSVQTPTLDRPKLDKLTAWRRGLVALDYTRLADAVAEMNRYSTVELVIDDPEVAERRISGVFRAGDSQLFAQAVAQTHRLQVAEEPKRIVIFRSPR